MGQYLAPGWKDAAEVTFDASVEALSAGTVADGRRRRAAGGRRRATLVFADEADAIRRRG